MARLKRSESGSTSSPLFKKEPWGVFTKGCEVKVAGEPGYFTFLNYCANPDTGSEWYDVFGGEKGYETLRAFKIDRVSLPPVRRIRGRRAS